MELTSEYIWLEVNLSEKNKQKIHHKIANINEFNWFNYLRSRNRIPLWCFNVFNFLFGNSWMFRRWIVNGIKP